MLVKNTGTPIPEGDKAQCCDMASSSAAVRVL
jgi:hypothetical protein